MSSACPIGWRRLLLLPLALAGCLAIFLLARTLALGSDVDARWRLDAGGRLQLQRSPLPALHPFEQRLLDAVILPGEAPMPIDGRRALQSSRWIAADEERDLAVRQQAFLSQALASSQLRLSFGDGSQVALHPQARGLGALGTAFWLLSGMALALSLIGGIVPLLRPEPRNLLYALMAQAQAAQLLLSAVDSVSGLGSPMLLAPRETDWRMALDVVTCAALLHSTWLYPTPLPGRRAAGAVLWTLTAGLCGALLAQALPAAWWWTQTVALGTGLAQIGLLGWSYRVSPHPFATVMRRFTLVAVSSLAVVTAVVALGGSLPAELQALAGALPSLWSVFFASLLLMAPFLTRSRHLLREFALLAGISTLAASADLLFVALFSFTPFSSLTASLFVALGLYAALRQWLVDQMTQARTVGTERLFEHLLRIARKIEQQPERTADWQLELFQAVFQPLAAGHGPSPPGAAPLTRWADSGATLRVPLAVPSNETDAPGEASGQLVLRFAERGKRLFTSEDARLADRIVEQLRRAVTHDHAIEQGRSEERNRLAQDLHDDIGARLLTLIYKAPDREMEDYLRHTLQDLKTLTRGLAATTHRLSHASGEWKRDIAQRLGEAGCELAWSFRQDEDLELGVTHWSALTRILRELVSNIIAHAGARHARIHGNLRDGWLRLSVADDGRGGTPAHWSPGLGVGGVRKRVRQLGGTIAWQAAPEGGIHCEVSVPLTAAAGAPTVSFPSPPPALVM